MQTYAIVVDAQSGSRKSDGRPYQMYKLVGQTPDGVVGVLKHFLKPTEINSQVWKGVKIGDVLSLDVEQKQAGYTSFTNIVAAEPTSDVTVQIKFAKAK